MKLLLCLKCNDIFNLSMKEKSCSCGNASGAYMDNLNATYTGDHVIPLCISNPSIRDTILEQRVNDATKPEEFYGARFEAWVCPANSKTFTKRGVSLDERV